MKLESLNNTATVIVADKVSHGVYHQQSVGADLLNNIHNISNNKTHIASNTHSDTVKRKGVRFDKYISCFYFKKIKDDDQNGSDNSRTLSLIDRHYRQEMDKQARMNGLPFAAGHHGFRDGPRDYNHTLALYEYSKL